MPTIWDDCDGFRDLILSVVLTRLPPMMRSYSWPNWPRTLAMAARMRRALSSLRKSKKGSTNQHGVSHWPLLRLLAAHDLYTGLALRPEWGAVNGSEAVSEQGLLEKLIERLPSEATVVGVPTLGFSRWPMRRPSADAP